MARKKADSGVVGAVEAYLGGLCLDGVLRPLAQVAVLLAESLEEAPLYARARLGRELHDLLNELSAEAARETELEARRAQRDRGRAWAG
jgi:signal transduction histidine kinase